MNNFFIGNNPVIAGKQEVEGQFVLIDDEKYYQIKNYDCHAAVFYQPGERFQPLDVHFQYRWTDGGS
ncbi:MAG: hypothetical protein QM800_00585 [Paludibacter sp.]